jgi:LytS/YehU family sensor histidine kinase
MYRSLVLSADKIKRTLREELEFTEDYLALEQFRFRDRFRYVIEVQPEVDLNTEVPKMVIQSPVENAVKHGLQHRGNAGEVRISIRKEEKSLVIEVADNGIGRKATSGLETSGTGKGMEMMSQFFELYHRITGMKVQSEVTDLKDEAGNPVGTTVVVRIYSGT